jgi:hypothetical protein
MVSEIFNKPSREQGQSHQSEKPKHQVGRGVQPKERQGDPRTAVEIGREGDNAGCHYKREIAREKAGQVACEGEPLHQSSRHVGSPVG